MNKLQAKTRIEKLKTEINRHRYLYHALNRQEISEEALDSLKHELTTLEHQFPEFIHPDSPTQRVAGIASSKFKKVPHTTRMLSLNDVFSTDELQEWEDRIKKLLPHRTIEYFAEVKIDGFAISLVYENGAFHIGSTRGDGTTGEDVTRNLKAIESIPLALPDISQFNKEPALQKILHDFPRVRAAVSHAPARLEIRGEVYMSKRAFEETNKEQASKGLPPFANPRNIAAGSVRQLDPSVTASRQLEFLAYDIITDLGQETHEEEHLIAKLFGFKTMDPSHAANAKNIRLAAKCKDLGDIHAFWKHIHEKRENLPFLIDGIVVQVNNGSLFNELGVVGKAPRGAVAFKFPGKESTTHVKDIFVQIGRTGVLTPVAVLEPVEIGGVTVSRATLHNTDEIDRLDVRIGDTVVVQRAGDVIPDIIRVLKNLRPANAKKFHMPKTFCGQHVVRPEGEVAHRIPNPDQCELVGRERFYYFTSKHAFDMVGVGPKIIDKLIDEGLVQDPADLFKLSAKDVTPIERFAEKSAENLIRAIQAKKNIELPRFIYALGIRHVGEETAIDLARHFETIKKLASASKEELTSVSNIGSVVAESIHEWFKDAGHKHFIEKLLQAGVTVAPAQKQKSQKFSGKTFVLTGSLETMSRDIAKQKIRMAGGDITETVSKKTDYVVAGKDPGSKFNNAQRLGVRILTEKEFLKIIGE